MNRFNPCAFSALALAVLLAFAFPALAAPVDNNRDTTINGEWTFQQDQTFKKDVILEDQVKVGGESVFEAAPVFFYDEFLGTNGTLFQGGATGGGYSGSWTGNATAGGNATVVGSIPPGYAQLNTNGSSGAQTASMYWNDNLALDISKGLVFETRVTFPTLPANYGTASIGLMGNATQANPLGNGWFALFHVGGSNPAPTFNTDVNATFSDGVANLNATTGATIAANTARTYRIETSTDGVLSFFIDGAQVGAATAMDWSTAGGRLYVQPYLNVYQGGASTNAIDSNATMRVDYVRVYQKTR